MTNADDLRAKMPCPLYTLFCIMNKISTNQVEPWYEQIKTLADGADKYTNGMHRAVILGMYPELEEASKEFTRRFMDIYTEHENNPHKDYKHLEESLKKLSAQIGEEYNLNKNRYFFNEVTEEQAKRVQKLKDIEIKKICHEFAEVLVDPLHIIMQGLTKKLDPKDCYELMDDFHNAQTTLKHDKNNNIENIEYCRQEYPGAYLIYKQVKNCLKVAEIDDYSQIIDAKNYEKFVQTLGSFEYKGKKYNLLDAVRPITQKRNRFAKIIEVRPNTVSPSRQDERVL
jgi:hypothetical protein